MRRLEGSSLILLAILLVIFGVFLRWDLVDWIIDAAGFLLIVLGIILGVVGLIQVLTGGGKRSRSDF